MALHLHDNDGTDDWHSLPFSGNIQWDGVAVKLKANAYNGSIALEVGNKRFEHIAKPDDFLKFAVESAERMRKLCETNKQ